MFRNICQVKYTCPPHFSKVHTAESWCLLQLSCEGFHCLSFCLLKRNVELAQDDCQ